MKEFFFLDEINCVSETLAPAMLQFLQYKTFGQQYKVPEGWIIVTAGNPPEYNYSVREFDIASWDRVKRMDVEPDYSVWKTYAYEQGDAPGNPDLSGYEERCILFREKYSGWKAFCDSKRLGRFKSDHVSE